MFITSERFLLIKIHQEKNWCLCEQKIKRSRIFQNVIFVFSQIIFLQLALNNFFYIVKNFFNVIFIFFKIIWKLILKNTRIIFW